MSFTAPWFLLSALGAAVPILLHLYGQQRARRVFFPSLMLLQRAERERSSLSRLRQVWLMLLRAMAILCLALALAQPVLTSMHLPHLLGAPIVLLIDDSLSMQARGLAHSAFVEARQAVERIKEQLPTNQKVSIARLSEAATSWQQQPVNHTAEYLKEPGYGAVDIPKALSRLWSTHDGMHQQQGRWVLLTDLQASGWRTTLEAPEGPAELIIVDCGAEGPNAAITGLEMIESPALVGRTIRLRVSIQVSADYPAAQPIPIKVFVNGRVLPPVNCRLVAGRGETLVEWIPQQTGDLQVKATLPTDRLEADNADYLVIPVRQQLRVTVVGAEMQTRWVRLALSPTPGSPIRAQQTVMATAGALDGQDVAVLVSNLTDGSSVILRTFIERGLGAVLCLPTWGLSGLLDLEDEAVGPLVTPSSPIRFGSFDGFRPPLQAFANAAAGDLCEPVFRRYVQLSLPPDSPWRVLARFRDQTPALLAGQIGRGRVVIANFTPDPATTDLTSLPVFVPLMHRLVGYVARGLRPDQTTCLVGQMVDALSLEGGVVGSESPSDTRLLPGTNPGLRPDRPGFHDLRWQEVQDQEVLIHLAANLDPLESDLKRLTIPQLQQRCAPVAVTVCRPEELLEALPVKALSLATPLWVLGLLLLVLELLLLVRPRDRGVPARGLEMDVTHR